MSLRVWLPLTKDLRNQGLDDVTVTNNGATFDANGKLGGCYYFNRSAPNYLKITNPLTTATNGVSMAFWVKLPSNGSVNDQLVHIGNGSGWTNNRFTCFVRGGNSTLIFACGDGTNSTQYSCASSALTLNQWTHVVCLYENNKMKIYLNGVLDKEYSTTIVPSFTNVTYVGIGAGPNVAEPATAYLNDVRIYDHCLSPMEVKELAKGLVLHYPLNNSSIQEMNNCWSLPTFETSSSNGGSSHWGASGSNGNYGQSTDKNYIFRVGQTYSHWVSNASTATGNYLLYQSPTFEGGSRSLQCICKEENSIPITDNICYSCWNAGASGGAINNHWTSIVSLGDGFYWCKCEDLRQDGSNDLVGIYIKPGYKVYFSEVWLENDKTICSNPFFQSNIVYDCSGFCNNGTRSGTLTISSDTPKYGVSTYFPNTTTTTTFDDKCWITAPFILNNINQLTVSFWFKKEAITRGGLFTTNVATYTGTNLTVNDYDNSVKIRASDGTSVTLGNYDNLIPANTWCHWVVTFDGINVKVYVNSILKNTVSYSATKMLKNITNITLGANTAGGVYRTAKGNYSDFRIYATALSAEDVKDLYELGATIDTNGVLSTYEFTEQ